MIEIKPLKKQRVTPEHDERLKTGKALILGASGLVGSRFVEIFGSDNCYMPAHEEFDITDKEKVKKVIEVYKPDVIVNFVAFTNVNEGEEQRKAGLEEAKKLSCWQINVEGLRNILDAIDPEKTHFIQISTDMVFSGSEDDKGPYNEDHPIEKDPRKLTWYGYTKGQAEKLIRQRLGNKASILRIIYPVREKFDKKLDYLRGPLKKYRDNGNKFPHALFDDQQVSITFIDEACEALRRIIDNKKYGVFHASSPDTTTPHKIVSHFLSGVEGHEVNIDKSKVGDLKRRYPPFGGLSVSKTENELSMKFSTTEEIVDKLINQGLA